MRSLGLLPIKCGDRFIPNIYKICSKKQRLEILAGLIDTDGWVDKTSLSFCSKSKRLRDDVSFIARSLGFFVTNRTKQSHCFYKGEKRYGTYYQTTIIGDLSKIPLRIKRKLPPTRIIKKQHNVVGFTIEPLNEDNYYGFSISGDGRYLLNDFTVTHNSGKTYTAVGVARELNMGIAVVCPKAVIYSWNKVIKDHFGMKPEFVLNYESVKTGKYKDIGVWKSVSKISTREFFQWNISKNTLIIFDESHRLKGHGTQNSEIAIAAKKQGYKILCCSATNAINPIELKCVGLITGLYKTGKWLAFLREHGCEQGRFGWEFSGDKDVLKKLHADLFLDRGVRVRRDDIKGFPDSEVIAEAYNIDEKSQKELKEVYEEMEKELKYLQAQCKNTKEYQINSMVIMLRARQQAELIKVPLFVEMVEDALEDGMSVVIFVNFSETVRALSKRLNTNCVVWGENKGNERDVYIADFQADKKRVIIVNIKAGGAGLSLHDLNGNYPRLSLISPTPSAVDLRQALGRVWRDGGKTKSLQKIIFAANTVEEEVCEKVKLKLSALDTINDGDLQSNVEIFDEI
jgi:superfamily II DNA or RNA helicase